MSTPVPSAAGRILVVNAGSSSLKLRVLDRADAVTAGADLPAPRGAADGSEITFHATIPAAAVRALLIAAREDIEIAGQVRATLAR